jgi:hypothetical protein
MVLEAALDREAADGRRDGDVSTDEESGIAAAFTAHRVILSSRSWY